MMLYNKSENNSSYRDFFFLNSTLTIGIRMVVFSDITIVLSSSCFAYTDTSAAFYLPTCILRKQYANDYHEKSNISVVIELQQSSIKFAQL